MGRNFVSVCHVHKVRHWYYRGEEAKPMHDFYEEHDGCIREDPENVGTYDDQIQEVLIPEEYQEHPTPTPKPNTALRDKIVELINEEVVEPIIHGEGVNPKDYFGIDSEELADQILKIIQDNQEPKKRQLDKAKLEELKFVLSRVDPVNTHKNVQEEIENLELIL